MKRSISMLLTLVTVLSCLTFFATPASADIQTYDLGEMTVVKINGLWTAPSTNALAVFTPGQSMNGKYWTKIYARYDEELEAYIVEEKIGCHRNYPKVVEQGCIGVMINYAPLTTAGSDIAKANWLVFDKIKVGDRLTLSGIDVANRTIETTGTFGESGFTSNAKIKVTAARDTNAPTSPYSDKVIVAMGDSITAGGGWTYDLGDAINGHVINSGFGGDTATASFASRYDTYVRSYNPDIVIVCFGINDALEGKGSDAAISKYVNSLRNIYNANTAIGAKTVFMTPNQIKVATFDGPAYAAHGGLQGYIDKFISGMVSLADELNAPCININEMWKETGLAPASLLDSTHPTEVGYDANLELIIPFFKNNFRELCDYEGDFAFGAGLGDTNCDGIINNIDAGLILKYDAGEIYGIVNGDVNNDGEVNNLDASLILKYDAGLFDDL